MKYKECGKNKTQMDLIITNSNLNETQTQNIYIMMRVERQEEFEILHG